MKKYKLYIIAAVPVILLIAYAVYIYSAEAFMGPLEITISPSDHFTAGTDASLRVIAFNRKNNTPVEGAEVSMVLKEKKNNREHPLFKGKTKAHGSPEVKFKVPEDTNGSCELTVYVASGIGEGTLSIPVTILEGYRVLVTTDKEVYRPGQTIHIRSLVFQKNNKAAKHRDVTIEMVEPKGYRIFERKSETCEYGIAETDFTLGDEINTGLYTIRVNTGDCWKEKTVSVDNYTLPKFQVTCTAEKQWYMPGEAIKGKVEAAYFFGKPVTGGDVTITIRNDTGENSRGTAEIRGVTDTGGIFKFHYQASRPGALSLAVTVRDKTGHREKTARKVPVSGERIIIDVIPESGELKTGLENIVYVVTAYPDGTPAACDVAVETWVRGNPKKVRPNSRMRVQTGRWGIGELRVPVPPGADWPRDSMRLEARDGRGNKGKKTWICEVTGYKDQSILLRTDKSIYTTDEAVELTVLSTLSTLSGGKQGYVYLDILGNGQHLLAKEVEPGNGSARIRLPLTGISPGLLTCRARRVYHDPGRFSVSLRDIKKIILRPSETKSVTVDIRPGKKTYAPGEEAAVGIQTRREGRACPAALGIDIVDESVHAIHAPGKGDRGFEKFHADLDESISAPGVRPAGFSLPDLLWNKKQVLPPGVTDKIGSVLLASQPQPGAAMVRLTTQKLEKLERKKRYFEFIIEWFFLLIPVFIALSLPVLLLRNYKGNRKKMVFDLSVGLGFLLFQVLLFIAAERVSNSWVYFLDLSRDSFPWLGGAVVSFILLMIIRAIRCRKRDNFNGFYVSVLIVTLVLEITVLTSLFEYYSYDGRAFTNAALLLLFVGSMVSFFAALWRKSIRRSMLITILLLIFLVHPFYTVLPWIRVVLIFTILTVFFTYLAGYVRTRDKIAVPLTIMIVTASLFLGVLVFRELKSEYYHHSPFYSSPDYSSSGGMHWDLQSMWASRSPLSLASLSFPEHEPVNAAPDRQWPGWGKQLKPARLRQFFPETLYSNPRIITGKDGKASISVKAADTITRWRVSALAHTVDGYMGAADTHLTVFRDFFIDASPPKHLTQGDEIAVPAAIYNYLDRPLRVSLSLQKANGFELKGKQTRTTTVKAKDIKVEYFTIRAKETGDHRLLFRAENDAVNDAVVKEVTVVPASKEIRRTYDFRLKGEVRQKISVPRTAVKNSEKLVLNVYPGFSAQLVEGLESMLRMPYGCFEQTCSVTYPNVLALAYMKKTGRLTPGIRAKAERYISSGYQRLLTFETPTGGFSLYGGIPARTDLTAYGLMLFSDMAKVYPVDESIIPRLQEWLCRRMEDGHWRFDGYCGASSSAWGSDFSATAYVTWALLRSGFDKEDKQIEKAFDYMERNYRSYLNEPAALGLYVLALRSARKYPGSVTRYLEELLSKNLPGDYRSVETVENTALATLAMLETPNRAVDLSRVINGLIKSKGPYGYWGSTRATVLTLKVLSAYSSKTALGRFRLWVGDTFAKEMDITEKNNRVLHVLDLNAFARGGSRELTVSFQGEGELFCRVVSSYYLRWDDPVLRADGKSGLPMRLDLKCSARRLSRGDMLDVDVSASYTGKGVVRNAILDLGIPPGFTVNADDFRALLNRGKIERFEMSGGRVILYCSNLDKVGIRFRYRLKAVSPGRVCMPESMVYDYYDPRVKAVFPLRVLVVEEAGHLL